MSRSPCEPMRRPAYWRQYAKIHRANAQAKPTKNLPRRESAACGQKKIGGASRSAEMRLAIFSCGKPPIRRRLPRRLPPIRRVRRNRNSFIPVLLASRQTQKSRSATPAFPDAGAGVIDNNQRGRHFPKRRNLPTASCKIFARTQKNGILRFRFLCRFPAESYFWKYPPTASPAGRMSVRVPS